MRALIKFFFGLLLLCGGLFKKCIKTIKADFQTARLSSKKKINHFTRKKNNNTKHITISTLTQQEQKGYFQIFGKKKKKNPQEKGEQKTSLHNWTRDSFLCPVRPLVKNKHSSMKIKLL